MFSPINRPSILRVSSRRLFRLTTSGDITCFRLKARICRVSPAARTAAAEICSRGSRAR
ncbi:MAG: hypothetical protein ACD_75C01862G0001 [uncultured bacterium]|nr:MAG: hypothetical protein ACD_75C01862G0001 [uncultured bacterium]